MTILKLTPGVLVTTVFTSGAKTLKRKRSRSSERPSGVDNQQGTRPVSSPKR
jgi:hypothetical protein